MYLQRIPIELMKILKPDFNNNKYRIQPVIL